MRSMIILALVVFLASSACGQVVATTSRPAVAPETVARIASFFDDPRFAHAHWGVLIRSLETGEVLVERNADRLFMPASNQKLLTGAAALRVLGPEFRFRTEFRRRGPISKGVLGGDLVVVGDGDPTLYTRFHRDPKDVFRAVAASLKSHGIREIEGNLIGDDDAFDEVRHGYGWSLEDLDWYYAAEIGALQFNENYVDLDITPPAEPGDPVKVTPRLQSRYFQIENRLVAVAEGEHAVALTRERGSNHVVLSGRVRAGRPPFERAPSLVNPTLFYVTVLEEVLREEGIAVRGEPVDCDDIPGWEHPPANTELVYVHLSPPLGEMLALFLKRSQNLYGETLVRALARNRGKRGSFGGGRRVLHRDLEALGIDPRSYVFADGSGLSRHDLLSPRLLVRLLSAMRQSEHWETWRAALPIAGRDGTLRRRMKGTAAEGRVRAKTGTIENVRGLSGYLTTADGEPFVFSFLVNAHLRSTKETEEITDGALALLAAVDRR